VSRRRRSRSTTLSEDRGWTDLRQTRTPRHRKHLRDSRHHATDDRVERGVESSPLPPRPQRLPRADANTLQQVALRSELKLLRDLRGGLSCFDDMPECVERTRPGDHEPRCPNATRRKSRSDRARRHAMHARDVAHTHTGSRGNEHLCDHHLCHSVATNRESGEELPTRTRRGTRRQNPSQVRCEVRCRRVHKEHPRVLGE
jgi:hypothetical protein